MTPKPPSEIDVVRFAAFLDGEGCICITRDGAGTLLLILQITNTDVRLPHWLKDTFGGRISIERSAPPRKTRYDWHVSNRTAAALLRLCRPYLIIKGEQTDLALAFQETVGRHRDTVGRIVPTPPSVVQARVEMRTQMQLLNKRGVA